MKDFLKSFVLSFGTMATGIVAGYYLFSRTETGLELYDQDNDGYVNTISDTNLGFILTNNKDKVNQEKGYFVCTFSIDTKILMDISLEELPQKVYPLLENCLRKP